ncbi:MAG: sugar phosphate isomerase/epimerase [Bryobacterales bacterium]|nr:sugar phosphate isomerase/epimerase [Bryobacterales bacterium]
MPFAALLHSVSYSGSWGQALLPLDTFIDRAADLGYQGVMLMAKRPHLSVLDFGSGERAALRRKIEVRGLGTVCVAGYNNFTGDWEHGEVPQLEMQVAYLTELARLTADIGGALLRVFTGYEHPAAGYLPQWNRVVSALQELARRAAPLGVTIGVQNHHDIGCGWEAQLDLVRAVDEPNCRPLFDAWSPALHGADVNAAARYFGPLAPHTTVANYRKRPRYRYNADVINYDAQTPYAQAVPIDEGFIDYRQFLGAMRAAGFNGSVAYEMCSPLDGGGSERNLDMYARRFIEFLQTV